jgi:very-short-patch-repair endonuclease
MTDAAVELDGPDFTSIGQAAIGVLELAVLAYVLVDECQSPIEVQLGAQLRHRLRAPYELILQYKIGRYRYDFAVAKAGKICLLIECDGREFHSSAEQKANDRRKDQIALEAGIGILRFTGSRIFRDPEACVADVCAALGVRQR